MPSAQVLSSGGDATSRPTFMTPTIAPAYGAMVVAAITNRRLLGAELPILTGTGLTWIQQTTIPFAAGVYRLTIFTAERQDPNGISETINISFDTNQAATAWVVLSFAGVVPNQGFVQFATNTGATRNVRVPLRSFAKASNATLYIAANTLSTDGFTADASHRSLDATGAPLMSLATTWRAGNDRNPGGVWRGTNLIASAFAAELHTIPEIPDPQFNRGIFRAKIR